ncbi:MAG: pyruvate, water dikinase regulatory protein [Pseudomonadota bacterium]
MKKPPSVFHVHMISDSTGETIIACARAVTAQYLDSEAVEHVHPLVRNERQLQQVMDTVEANPGIVLYTVVNTNLNAKLEAHCQKLGVPCVSVLEPIFQAYQSFLGSPTQRVVGAQHALNNDYFNRIDALNFTMLHDDGVIPEDVEEADIILLGISRTSKTPTSIYLANRGVKTANIPLVPNVELPSTVIEAKTPLIVTLVASVDRIQQVRQNRLLELNAGGYSDSYADRASIAEELSNARKLSSRYGWPMLDVSRKSIEETAAGILSLHDKHLARLKEEKPPQEDQPQ